MDAIENILDEMKQYFLELYKKEFGLIPKIIKAKDGIYIYLFNRGASGVHNTHSQKAVVGTQRYFIGIKDWEYATQNNQKDFYDRDYVLDIDDYLYNINKDSITLDMAIHHTASFEAKLSDLRVELLKIVKDKNKLKADEKELYEFVMSNKQYVTFIKDNIRTILTKGDDKKGLSILLFATMEVEQIAKLIFGILLELVKQL